LSFTISIEKNAYLEGEPIIVTHILTNVSNADVMIGEPVGSFTQDEMEWLDGNTKDIPKLCRMTAAIPSDHAFKLEPGASMRSLSSLMEIYVYGLPVGRYSLKAKYAVSTRYYRCWNGELRSNTVKFSVVSPAGKEKDAFLIYKEARDLINKGDDLGVAHAKMDTLISNYRNTVYAKPAHFLKAESLWVQRIDGKQNFEGAIEEFRKFLSKYPDSPYWSKQAQQLIAIGLFLLGKKEEARIEFQKLPEGYLKQNYLEKLK
jgi:tetratricopeptide (TPR) repeat protein